jgi:hypothetical protein
VDEIQAKLESVFVELLEGARGDIEKYARQMVEDLQDIAVLPRGEKRDELRAELLSQVKMLGELNRLRANDAAWRAVEHVMDLALTIGLRTLGVPPAPPSEA